MNISQDAVAVRAVSKDNGDGTEVINYLYDTGAVSSVTLEGGVAMTDEIGVGRPWAGTPDEFVQWMGRFGFVNCSEILAH